MKETIAISFLFFLVTACHKESASSCNSTTTLCSCDLLSTSSANCLDYEGKSVDDAQTDCGTGTFSKTARCSTTGRVGTCKIQLFNAITYQRYYSDAVTHQVSCTVSAMGTGFLGTVEWQSN